MPTPRPTPRPKPQPPCHLWAEAEEGNAAIAMAAVAATATMVLRNMGVSPFFGCAFHILMPNQSRVACERFRDQARNLRHGHKSLGECLLTVPLLNLAEPSLAEPSL